MDAFAAERSEVMAAWEGLRARVRDEGDAVALSPAFRETLDRHGALMKQAASFRARPRVFERLLSERAGIGDGELQELRDVHARAGSYLRSAAARAAHARQDAERESERAHRDGEPAPEPARQTESAAETTRPDPPAAQTSQDTGREAASGPADRRGTRPERGARPGPFARGLSPAPARLAARTSSGPRGRASIASTSTAPARWSSASPPSPGARGLPPRRARLEEIVGQYRAHAAARDRVRGFLRDVERHWLRYHAISRRARNLDIDPREQRSWPIWLDRNERLLRAGRAILDDPATYGLHLDRIEDGRERLRDRGLPDGAVLVGVPHAVPVPRQGALLEHVSAAEEKRNVPANARHKWGTMTRPLSAPGSHRS